MANPANVMKMLQALGGMASESYGTGQPMQGGQPILPKPLISGPGVLSPYAPMNNPANLPENQPNGGHGLKPPKMGDSDSHTANQLAQYLVTNGKSFRPSTDPGAFHRAPGTMRVMPGVTAGVRG